MTHSARFVMSLFAAAFLLLFAAGANADSFTITLNGTAPDGTSVSGTLNLTAVPDGLGDGGFSVTSITSGSLNLEGGSYTVSGLTPLDGSPSPSNSAFDAFYICAFPPSNCGFHYFGYNNLLFPTTGPLTTGLLFYAGLGEPAELYCSTLTSCDLAVWVGGSTSVLQGLFPNGGNNPPDAGFEDYAVTAGESESHTVPEPSTLLLSGLGLLALTGISRRARFA